MDTESNDNAGKVRHIRLNHDTLTGIWIARLEQRADGETAWKRRFYANGKAITLTEEEYLSYHNGNIRRWVDEGEAIETGAPVVMSAKTGKVESVSPPGDPVEPAPRPPGDDGLDGKSRPQLMRIAKTLEVTGRNAMDAETLRESIRAAQAARKTAKKLEAMQSIRS